MLVPAPSLARSLRLLRQGTLLALVPFVVAAGCATDPPSGTTVPRDDVGTTASSPADALRAPIVSAEHAFRFHAGERAGSLVPDALCNNNGATAGFGNGSDLAYVAVSGTFPETSAAMTAAAAANATSISVSSTTGFKTGDLLLIHQTQGTNAGTWETAQVSAIGTTTLTLALPLLASYAATGAQVVRVSQFSSVTVAAAVTVTAPPWNGTTGGIIAFVSSGTVSIAGSIDADGAGFQGGGGDGGGNTCPGTPKGGFQGESSLGPGVAATPANGQGGGGGGTLATFCCSGCPATKGSTGDSGGGGGGYGTPGVTGDGSAQGGGGGAAIGTADLSTIFLGGGGGGGGGNCGDSSPPGANGGGIVLIAAPTVTVGATGITARGAAAGVNTAVNWEGGGGGGAGGAVVLSSTTVTLVADSIDASGGAGSTQCAGEGGDGGVGRVRVACGTLNGTTCATASATGEVVPTPELTAYCAFTTCTSSAVCPGATPVCDPTTRICVECLANSNCTTNVNGPICDLTKDTCGTCDAGNDAACTGTTPVCNTAGTNDVCAACNGNNGSAATLPCPTAADPACKNTGACVPCTNSAFCAGTAPVCGAGGTCVACNGDDGTSATDPCPTSVEPYCEASGACGKCTSDAQCGTGHAGPFCNTTTGACGNTCFTDAECGAGNWCDNLSGAGTCQPQVTNGNPVPGGTCTPTLGARACVSGVCDTNGNDCGYRNGDGPCTAGDGTTVCDSTICATTGPNAGKCEQCIVSSTCAAATPVCDPATNACVVCDGDNGTGVTDPCSSSAEPDCLAGGTCGKCTSDAQCGTGHAGPFCNTATGACGSACFTDAECGAGNWCDNLSGTGICQPQVTNGNPVPGGTCVTSIASRACVSGVCDTDNLCGYKNGDGPCTPTDGSIVCRSTLCGTGAEAGKCVQCTSSAECAGNTPVCDATNEGCVACNGDNGTTTTDPCSSTTAPTCNLTTGACGKCTSDAQCGTGHAGPFCNTTTGVCGSTCTTDAECGAGKWCDNLNGAAGVCQAKVANGDPVPGGTCTTTIGSRACVSGVCDVDNACGYKNGDGPCNAGDGTTVCRSTICATSGPEAGLCVQCTSSSTCSGITPVCDPTTSTCVGCNGDNGMATTDPCSSTAAPYCILGTGVCSVCTVDTQCGAGHAGPFCNVGTGACGNTCFTDVECGAGNWCDNLGGAGVCTGKTPNGQPIPGGTCSVGLGSRACQSGVCAITGPNANDCVQCTSNLQCVGTSTPVCNTSTNTCTIGSSSGGDAGADAGDGGDGGIVIGGGDSGSSEDSGTTSEDSGSGEEDSGTSEDSGSSADSGTSEDSGSSADSGTTGQDSGSLDSGTSSDAGDASISDSGPSDSGPSTDAGDGSVADGASNDSGSSSEDSGSSSEDSGTGQNDAGGDAMTGSDSGIVAVGGDSGNDGSVDDGTVEGGGCSCRTHGARDTGSDGALFAIAAAGFLVQRRGRRAGGKGGK